MYKYLLISILTIISVCRSGYTLAQQSFKRFERVIFKDDFTEDTIGSFPINWEIRGIQFEKENYYRGNKETQVCGIKVLEENNERFIHIPNCNDNTIIVNNNHSNDIFIKPLIKNECAGDSFTFECDFRLLDKESPRFGILFNDKNQNYIVSNIIDTDGSFGAAVLNSSYAQLLDRNNKPIKCIGKYPKTLIKNKWYHLTAYYSNNKMIYYINYLKIAEFNEIYFKRFEFLIYKYLEGDLSMDYKNFLITGSNCFVFKNIVAENKLITYAIHFDKDQYVIKPESSEYLNELAGWLKQNNKVKLEIDGHTDNDGDTTANLILSQARADAVKKQLVSLGIENSRLTTKGFGDKKPIQSNRTPEGKAKNRRVEFIKQ